MTPDDKIAAFLAEPRNAVVAGTRADGRPPATPNWFAWDASASAVAGPLRTFTMGGSDHPSRTVLARRLQKY